MKTRTIEGLSQTLELVDSVSQDAFSRIRSTCAVVLLAMEQHTRPIDTEDPAQLFKQIEQTAEEAENFINAEAESLGCNHQDTAWHRRIDARHAWRSAIKVEG